MAYTKTPGKAALIILKIKYNIRTKAISHPSHSAIPPQTPAITLLFDRVSFDLYMAIYFQTKESNLINIFYDVGQDDCY